MSCKIKEQKKDCETMFWVLILLLKMWLNKEISNDHVNSFTLVKFKSENLPHYNCLTKKERFHHVPSLVQPILCPSFIRVYIFCPFASGGAIGTFKTIAYLVCKWMVDEGVARLWGEEEERVGSKGGNNGLEVQAVWDSSLCLLRIIATFFLFDEFSQVGNLEKKL